MALLKPWVVGGFEDAIDRGNRYLGVWAVEDFKLTAVQLAEILASFFCLGGGRAVLE
jgi:hypothetical protein